MLKGAIIMKQKIYAVCTAVAGLLATFATENLCFVILGLVIGGIMFFTKEDWFDDKES